MINITVISATTADKKPTFSTEKNLANSGMIILYISSARERKTNHLPWISPSVNKLSTISSISLYLAG